MTQLSVERAARNEAVVRDANELIEERRGEPTSVAGRTPFLCECADPYCKALVLMTLDEYEYVREGANRFALQAGHPTTEAVVVDENDRYVVVEKHGLSRQVAAVNAAVRHVDETLGLDDSSEHYVCECSVQECTERSAVTRAEYAEACTDPKWFFMIAGHPDPAHEVHPASRRAHPRRHRRSLGADHPGRGHARRDRGVRAVRPAAPRPA